MARFPGTETPHNRAGLRPGTIVRCRRSRANAARGLADRRGFVAEVRLQHARVVLTGGGLRSVWLENEALLPEDSLGDEQLERLRAVLLLLGGTRLEHEDDELIVFGDAYDASALDEVRALLGERLVACRVAPHGVHELATRLAVRPL